jgi:hypothetical protein
LSCLRILSKKNSDYKSNGGSLSTIDNNMTKIFDCHDNTKHSSILFLYNQKFDLLFESGLRAMRDKYYREAISSFATSLERFYEYCIKVLLFNNQDAEIEKSWKQISQQSERQLGAFIVLFLRNTQKTPVLLSNKMVELRNEITHKGYYPTEDETYAFSNSVLQIIDKNFNLIAEKSSSNIENYNSKYFNDLKSFAHKKIKEHSYYKKGIKVEPEFMF